VAYRPSWKDDVRELIRRQIIDSLSERVPGFTRRGVHRPGIQNKAIAVIGMRRADSQVLDEPGERVAALFPQLAPGGHFATHGGGLV